MNYAQQVQRCCENCSRNCKFHAIEWKNRRQFKELEIHQVMSLYIVLQVAISSSDLLNGFVESD